MIVENHEFGFVDGWSEKTFFIEIDNRDNSFTANIWIGEKSGNPEYICEYESTIQDCLIAVLNRIEYHYNLTEQQKNAFIVGVLRKFQVSKERVDWIKTFNVQVPVMYSYQAWNANAVFARDCEHCSMWDKTEDRYYCAKKLTDLN